MKCGIGRVESGLVPLQEQVAMAATELVQAIIELEQAVYWRDDGCGDVGGRGAPGIRV